MKEIAEERKLILTEDDAVEGRRRFVTESHGCLLCFEKMKKMKERASERKFRWGEYIEKERREKGYIRNMNENITND